MDSKGLLLLVMAFAAVMTSFAVDSDGVSSGSLPKPTSEDRAAAAAASKLIEALDEQQQAPASGGTQEHPKNRIKARKGVQLNETSTSAPIVATVPKATEAQLKNITTTTTPQVSVGNSTVDVAVGSATGGNATLNISTSSSNSTQPAAINVASSNVTTPEVAVPSASKPTTVTASTSTTTTTTTTKPPKKPKITYSVDDEPKLVQAAKPGYSSQLPGSTVSDANGRLHVEEPLAELSKEYIAPASTGLLGPDRNPGHREYVIPVVTLIFAIPLLAGLFLLSYRRAKEFWLTRHYRRMDFLVDGMYNY